MILSPQSSKKIQDSLPKHLILIVAFRYLEGIMSFTYVLLLRFKGSNGQNTFKFLDKIQLVC